MGKILSFRDILGLIKDKASLSKAALLSNPNSTTAVVRATTHSPPAPPDDRHVSALLLLGETSRATASPIVAAVMDRLHRTRNGVVALKCLLVIHNIIKRGPFILQDQLSIFPATGGYNYLKLSDFRDGATAGAWALSSWVRWYSRYLETLLSTSRVFGYFLCSSSNTLLKENQEQRISSYLNSDLIREFDSLVVLIEEICKLPDSLNITDGDLLIKEIIGLLSNDYLSLVNQILLRLGEFNERLSLLSFGDSVEFVCALKRLQDCREKLSALCVVTKPSIQRIWSLVHELKDRVGTMKVHKEGGRLLSWGTREKGSESARFEQRVLSIGDGNNVQFQSGRFSINRCPSFLVLDKAV